MSETAVSNESAPVKEFFRKDYRPVPYTVKTTNLDFNLDEKETVVTTIYTLVPNGDNVVGSDVVLDGEELDLVSISINDTVLTVDDYVIQGDQLTIPHRIIDQYATGFTLKFVVKVNPEKNLSLCGLYKSGASDLLSTQCEAMGFRRITYSLDRPDVLSVYRVRLEADKTKYPILLSNGNLLESGEVEGSGGQRHWAVWEDPFPKPSYLFALVAGDLGFIKDTYRTTSGRVVQLGIYSDKENVDKLDHAMYSIKESMKWDEDTFGLECDLDIYNIVATNDFNMGAMENKGLNIFNSALCLADPQTATDTDYERILGVIGHEYFHNWSGNRVTVRDWFQLTLKEGLTVFRDQWFSADKTSAAVKRIEDVKALRSRQFAEDAGPMAHPIRPEAYISMDNFYTATVYSKGAEVIGVYKSMLGEAGFKKGLALYFQRFDGQAVTCDDFRQAMADANNVDLTQMERWYAQAGTPTVRITAQHYDASTHTFSFTATQHTPTTPGAGQDAADKRPVPIPLVTGLVDAETGAQLLPTEQILLLTEASQTFTLQNIHASSSDKRPVLSTLRGFSAPVNLEIEGQEDADLVCLMAHDTDSFNRWDAGHRYFTRLLLQRIADLSGKPKNDEESAALPEQFVGAIEKILQDALQASSTTTSAEQKRDLSLLAYALTLPDDMTLLTQMAEPLDIDALYVAKRGLKHSLARRFKSSFLQLYKQLSEQQAAEQAALQRDFVFSPEAVGRRKLRNLSLDYLSCLPVAEDASVALELPFAQFQQSLGRCMTDELAALGCLISQPSSVSQRAEALAAFYKQATQPVKNALVLNKWFAIQAMADSPTLLDEDMPRLLAHEDFVLSNPNRARALLTSFSTMNVHAFHRADGAGYRLMQTQILALDAINPQVAARMLGCFALWKKFDSGRRAQMEAALQAIQATPGLSPDTYEVASRYLK